MQYKCDKCNDSGSLNKFGPYYDCTSCDAAEQRVALEKWCSETQQRGPSFDDCWAIHQRALAMAPKQEAQDISALPKWHHFVDEPSRRDDDCGEWCLVTDAISHGIIPAAPAAANGLLTQLPAPATMIVESDLGHRAYTADQMRAYGQACAAAGPDAALIALIHKAQIILAHHLPPDGPDAKATISALLGLLDGPESRAALSGAKGN